ncbi:ancylostoma secreted protein-like [Coccinella septempunctata]|uniref:ancylostoma secreted protein-like n=1 Tax=Coccinella septempunctata TaxID=41139 RepID=UPI001D077EEC|nr:ancylostoma secreted protein-like [Coccinella septempunctata]
MNEMSSEMDEIFKPTFRPYCASRDICRADCTCFNTPNCTVLQMEDSVRNHIVCFLNEIRDIQSRGQPSPAGIPILQYDHYLEQISVCWASLCTVDHSDCFIHPKFNETSQSVGQMVLKKEKAPIFLWNEMLVKWLGGVGILNVEIMTSLPEGEKGEEMYNYAQLLSDRIQFIGCAWALFNNTIIYVCTFGPRGPSQGDYICRIGVPCSKCPTGYECDFKKPFTNLCKPMTAKKTKKTKTKTSPEDKPVKILPHSRDTKNSSDRETTEESGDKKFLSAIAMAITIILIAVVVVLVGGFIAFYIWFV